MGQLKFSHSQLYDLTPSAFWNAVDGFYMHNENLERREWVRTRWQTCMLINIQLPRSKQMSLQKLLPFEWEKKSISELNSYERTLLEYQKQLKKQKNKTT